MPLLIRGILRLLSEGLFSGFYLVYVPVLKPVSYTHLDVYKRQVVYFACLYGNNEDEFIIRRMDRDLDSGCV